MKQPTREDIDRECKECIFYKDEYWCDNYKCNPCLAYMFCSKYGFEERVIEHICNGEEGAE